MIEKLASDTALVMKAAAADRHPVRPPRLDLKKIKQAPAMSTPRAISERLRATLPQLQAYVVAGTTHADHRAFASRAVAKAYREMATGQWSGAERTIDQAIGQLQRGDIAG